jgi:uncharacterized protein YceK
VFGPVTTAKSLLAVTLVAASVLSGCSSAKTTTSACRPAHAPEYPTTDAALTDGDAGGTWCVTVGQIVTVTLHVPLAQSSSPWQPITPSDTHVLEPVSNGVVSLVHGVTATFLAVREPGVVTIGSTRPGHPTWKATVVATSK